MEVQSGKFLTKKAFRELSPEAREHYLLRSVKEILEINKDFGVSASDIKKIAPFSSRAIEKALKVLLATNQAYSVKRGPMILYFSNTRLAHPIFTKVLNFNGKEYRFSFLENPFGKFVYIQERQKGKFGFETSGGIMVPSDKISEFIDCIQSLILKVEE